MKRLIEEASKLREENKIYKNELESLTNENSTLKEQNEKYKNEIKVKKRIIRLKSKLLYLIKM